MSGAALAPCLQAPTCKLLLHLRSDKEAHCFVAHCGVSGHTDMVLPSAPMHHLTSASNQVNSPVRDKRSVASPYLRRLEAHIAAGAGRPEHRHFCCTGFGHWEYRRA